MQQPTRQELLSGYIKLRRGGLSMADAVEKLRSATANLAPEERKALSNEVMEWENSLENKRPAPANPVIQPISKPPAQPAQSAIPSANLLDLPQTDSLKEIQALQHLPVVCPKCGAKNTFNAQKCTACGNALTSERAHTRMVKRIVDDDDVQLGEQPRIYLAIKNHKKPLEVFVRQEMILGRSSPESTFKPNIDLAPYDGEKMGVSRSHASLKMENNTVVITDLKSSNFTYVNDERLHPHETRVLRHGDQVRLGELVIKVLFKL